MKQQRIYLNSNFVRFLISGGISAAVYLGILEILVGASVDVAWASALAYVFSAIVNYLMHYYYSFSVRSEHRETIAKFVVVLAIGAIFSSFSLFVFVNWLRLPHILGGVWVVTTWPIVSYFLLSRLVMR